MQDSKHGVNRCLKVLFFHFSLVAVCETEMEKVCRLSPEEHLQPFKDKMEEFINQGKWSKSSDLFINKRLGK